MTKMNYSETHLTKNFSRWHYFLVLFKIFLKEVFLLRIFLLIPVVMWNEFCDFLTMPYIFSFLFQVRMRWRKSTYKAYKESWLDILIYIIYKFIICLGYPVWEWKNIHLNLQSSNRKFVNNLHQCFEVLNKYFFFIYRKNSSDSKIAGFIESKFSIWFKKRLVLA